MFPMSNNVASIFHEYTLLLKGMQSFSTCQYTCLLELFQKSLLKMVNYFVGATYRSIRPNGSSITV